MSKLAGQIDLVVFVIVLAVAGWIVVSGIGTGRAVAEDALEAAAAARGELEAALAADRSPELAPRRALESVRAASERIAAQWRPAPRAGELPPGLFHHAAAVADARAGREMEVRFPGPREVAATADVGRIHLTWSENELATVEPTGWVVRRREGEGEGEAREVARLPAGALAWTDVDVRPGAVYVYEISALSDDETLRALGMAESPRSRPTQVRARRDYELDLLGPEDGGVRILVRKWSPEGWVEKPFVVAPGGAIGAREDDADFRTGARLLDVEQGVEEIEETRADVVFDEQGRVTVGPDGRPLVRERVVKRRLDVVTATYENELGQPERLVLRR